MSFRTLASRATSGEAQASSYCKVEPICAAQAWRRSSPPQESKRAWAES